MQKYNISEVQAKEIQNYSQTKNKRVKEIRNSNLAQDQKKAQIQQVTEQYHNQVKSILPVDKRGEYDKVLEERKLQAKNVYKILKEYRTEFRKLKNITQSERYAKQATIRQKYVEQLCVYMPVVKAERRIRQEDIKRMAHMPEIKNLNLPKEQALKMAGMKLSYQRRLLKLNEQTLPNKEKMALRGKMKNNYYSKVKTLIGDVK